MKNTIIIGKDGLLRQIDLRNYYMGEAAKRKDIDAVTIQSSKDDEELLYMFMTKACNELVTAVALRFPFISTSTDNDELGITFETECEYPSYLLPLLQQSITDYLVNEVTAQWLLTRRPEMAQSHISLRAALYSNVQQMFAKIYGRRRIRRRATDLAGI